MNDFYPEPLKILVVERYQMFDLVNIYRSGEFGIVNLNTRHFVIRNEFSPFGKGLKGVR